MNAAICFSFVAVSSRTDSFWRLDSSKFPQRLELQVSDCAFERLLRLSAQTGRSVRDHAEELICQVAAAQRL